MDLEEKFYEIMEKEDGFDELIGEVEDMLKEKKEKGIIKDYNHISDIDVFDSCGLVIYYLSICWIDNDNKLHIAGSSYYLR